jgi:hypothetical protein
MQGGLPCAVNLVSVERRIHTASDYNVGYDWLDVMRVYGFLADGLSSIHQEGDSAGHLTS